MAEQIVKTEYSEVMQKSYIDYSMSVITARALPDARDGLISSSLSVISLCTVDLDIPNRAAVCRTVAFCSIMYCARRIVRSSGKPFTAVSLLPDEVSSVTVYVDSETVRTCPFCFSGKRKALLLQRAVCQKKSYSQHFARQRA